MARKCAAGMVVFVSSGFSEWQRPGSEPLGSPGSPEPLTLGVMVTPDLGGNGQGYPRVQGGTRDPGGTGQGYPHGARNRADEPTLGVPSTITPRLTREDPIHSEASLTLGVRLSVPPRSTNPT